MYWGLISIEEKEKRKEFISKVLIQISEVASIDS